MFFLKRTLCHKQMTTQCDQKKTEWTALYYRENSRERGKTKCL